MLVPTDLKLRRSGATALTLTATSTLMLIRGAGTGRLSPHLHRSLVCASGFLPAGLEPDDRRDLHSPHEINPTS